MARRPTLYVAVRADYAQYQQDLAEIRSLARKQGKEIADALDGALSPQKAQRNLTSLATSLRTLSRQSNQVNLDSLNLDLQGLAKQTAAVL